MEKVREICRLKPHVSSKEAIEALKEIKRILEESQKN